LERSHNAGLVSRVMDLQWGSVPDWFAAIGTVGALFLGLAILWRDRRKDERVEAKEFISRLDVRRTYVPRKTAAWSGHLYAKNIGRSAIYDVVLFFPTLSVAKMSDRDTFRQMRAFIRVVRPGKGRVQSLHRAVADLHDATLGYNLVALPTDTGAADEARSVKPGQSISVVVDIADGKLRDARGWLLRFTDSHGRHWIRELDTGRFISRRKAGHIIRPLMGGELKFTIHNPPASDQAVR
jgi:hypothetical protein